MTCALVLLCSSPSTWETPCEDKCHAMELTRNFLQILKRFMMLINNVRMNILRNVDKSHGLRENNEREMTGFGRIDPRLAELNSNNAPSRCRDKIRYY